MWSDEHECLLVIYLIEWKAFASMIKTGAIRQFFRKIFLLLQKLMQPASSDDRQATSVTNNYKQPDETEEIIMRGNENDIADALKGMPFPVFYISLCWDIIIAGLNFLLGMFF